MISFLQKKIKLAGKQNFFFVLILLVLISLIPIIKTWGRFNIGGDVFLPLIPEASFKMAYQWNDTNNGVYLSNNYFFWIFPFYFLEQLGLNIYQRAFVFQFLIYLLSGWGMYKIYNLFNLRNKLFGLLSALFIVLSPHYLDHLIYYQGTVVIIWFSYFLFKFIRFKKLSLLDIVSLSIFLGFISDMPNPKYHFLILLLGTVVITLALFLKLLSWKDLASNLKKFILLFLCTLYISLPILYFGYFFLNEQIKINVKLGYQETGDALDYGFALMGKMIRLFHTPNLNARDAELINTPFFFFAYYAMAVIVLGIFPFIIRSLDKLSQKVYLIFYVLSLLFIFLSKSSNPPFGFIYDYFLTHFKAFAFMRTTAGIVIYAAVFYALIYGRIFQHLAENNSIQAKIKLSFLFLMVVILITIGYPYWSGHYFLNKSTVNPSVNRQEYGSTLPQEYFQSTSFFKKIRLDTKIDIYPYAFGYQYNSWGYYGFMLYPWIVDKPTITFDKKTSEGKIKSTTNSRYILLDKTLNNYQPTSFLHTPEARVLHIAKIDIYRKSVSDFTPHFYIPSLVIVSNKIDENLLRKIPPEKLAIVSDKKLPFAEHDLESFTDNPFIEYKKINPTKYRVRIHKALTPFSLIFTDNFHPLWKLYLSDKKTQQNSPKKLIFDLENHYKIFKDNQSDQADISEVDDLIKDGRISTLGNLEERNNNIYSYIDGKKIFNYSEEYKINFISKNFNGTVQNDNLDVGQFYETFFSQPLDLPHYQTNGFANSWFLDPTAICSAQTKNYKCSQSEDGLYDFELLLEFLPQKITNISYLISTVVIIFLLTILTFQSSFSLFQRIVFRKPFRSMVQQPDE